MTLSEEKVRRFFAAQLEAWPAVRGRFEALEREVQLGQLDCGDICLSAQWNPARVGSTRAAVDAACIERRPCFLCAENRPAEQHVLQVADAYHLLVNPFPILPGHLTLISSCHQPQRLPALMPLLRQAVGALPGHLLFYNGARCGASAPDHAHLQAALRGHTPLEQLWPQLSERLEPVATTHRPAGSVDTGLFLLRGYACPALVVLLQAERPDWQLVERAVSALPHSDEEDEAPFNLLSWSEQEDGHIVVVVFPRAKHRPALYYAPPESRVLVSPGALDMAGLLVTPAEPDFRRITGGLALDILQEVAISEQALRRAIAQL